MAAHYRAVKKSLKPWPLMRLGVPMAGTGARSPDRRFVPDRSRARPRMDRTRSHDVVLATIEDPAVIARILTHLGLPTEPGVPAAGRPTAQAGDVGGKGGTRV
jgi:hypothetical protein